MDPRRVQGVHEGQMLLCLDVGAAGAEQLLLGALGDDAALPDEDQVVGDPFDLVQEVGGEQDGAAGGGVVAEQAAHPVDAGRVEAVGRLVEDQDRRVTQEGVGDPEALAHAEGVVAQPSSGFDRAEGDPLEHLVDPVPGQPHGLGADGEDLAAGAAGVLGGGVEKDADAEPGVGHVSVVLACDQYLSVGRGCEPDHDAHGGGLPGSVGAEEAGDPTGSGRRRRRRRQRCRGRTSW